MLDTSTIMQLIREHKIAEAKSAIRAALKKDSDPECIFQACDFYQSMGMPRDALLLLGLKEGFPIPQSADSIDGRRLFWSARFLNNLGAAIFAVELARQIEPVNDEHHWILGNIFFGNFEDENALAHFEKMDQLTKDRDSKVARFRLMQKASALSTLGRFDQALELMKDIFDRTPEPLMAGHMLAYWGSILVHAARYEEALPLLHDAEKRMEVIRENPDFGFICKWAGVAHAKLGNFALADQYFERCHQLLFTTSHRPEAWLDLIHLRAQVRPVPEHWRSRTVHYPGHTPGAQKYFGAKMPTWFGLPSASIAIRLASDEYRVNDRPHLGIPKELLLLAYLTIVGDWGINAVRVQTILWPDEVYSFAQLADRLKKLMARLKSKYSFKVHVKDGHLSLSSEDLRRVAVHSGGSKTPWLLENLSAFRSSDVEKAYSISKAHASNYLNRWLQEGRIQKISTGRSSLYAMSPHP